jgi:iron uptake system component EfeO
VVGGAAGLIEEVAASKISGEEDRYSHTDLWDFQANIDGAQKIVDLLRPQLQKENSALLAKVDANFKKWIPFSANTAPKTASRPMTS